MEMTIDRSKPVPAKATVSAHLSKIAKRLSLGSGGFVGRRRIEIDTNEFVIYAIGDVHGCLDELLKLEEMIRIDSRGFSKPKLLLMLGDYVDRGPASSGVITYLLGRPPCGFMRLSLCGNHEEFMLQFLCDPLGGHMWLEYGGDRTLASYGIDIHHLLDEHRAKPSDIVDIVRAIIPPEHVRFLQNLPSIAYDDKFVFVHAGLRPGIALDRQSERDLMWIRQPFLSTGAGLPQLIIHGHTPTKEPHLLNNHISIDTGAYATGRLTALRLTDGSLAVLTTA